MPAGKLFQMRGMATANDPLGSGKLQTHSQLLLLLLLYYECKFNRSYSAETFGDMLEWNIVYYSKDFLSAITKMLMLLCF